MRKAIPYGLIGLGLSFAGEVGGSEVLDLLEKEDTPRDTQVYATSAGRRGEFTKGQARKEKSFNPDRISRDWLWERREAVRDGRSVVYGNSQDPFIQRAALDAYWHWIYRNGEVSHDSLGKTRVDTSKTQRLRIGGLIRALYSVDIEGQVMLDSDLDYQGIETFQARGYFNRHVYYSVGKARVPFSYNNTLDPTRRRIARLPALTAQLAPANTLGVLFEGTSNGDNGVFSWGLGWYSGEVDRNLSGLGGDGFLLAKVGYFVPTTVDDSEGGNHLYRNYQHWHFDYIHNFDGASSMSARSGHDHIVSTGLELRVDRADLSLGVLFATGGASTVWGANVEAGYWIMDGAVRLVGRYQYADSNDANALVVGFGPGAVASEVGLPYNYSLSYTGDSYGSIYLGADFHLYGDNAVLSAGVEYQVLGNSFITGQNIDALFFHWDMRFAF